ncbi:MAG TPA: protein kinase [Polyangia bacterium]|nr:protein kinase [Polyangia bacterium]
MGKLGRYQLIGRLATGGMAEVYLALSGNLSGYRTLVVVKRILPHLACNEQFVRMFLDEARIESHLDHPNVVRIIEVGHDGDEYFLAMELVQGKPLSTVLRRGGRDNAPLMPPLAAYIIAQAANGLGYAHTMIDSDGKPMQIVHRDVSPQNILISFEGAVKIIDFGIARAHGRGTRTNPGGLKGKIQYMSPEQASAAEVDPRSDVFALGVVLWEVLVGRRLFYRDNELAMMRAVVEEPIPLPSQFCSIPAELEAVVMRALDRDPNRRFHTAQEMGLALERYAFTNGSFSPQQLATYMKLLFASDFLQWKRTISSAMEMEATPFGPTVADGHVCSTGHPDPLSSGATLALRQGAPSEDGDGGQPDGATATPIMPAAGSFVAAAAPSAHDRLWVYGGIASLAMISIAGVLVLSQPRMPSRPPKLMSARIEALAPAPLKTEMLLPSQAAPRLEVSAAGDATPIPSMLPPAPTVPAEAVAPVLPLVPGSPPIPPPNSARAEVPAPTPVVAAMTTAPPGVSAPRKTKDPHAQRVRAAKLSRASVARSRRIGILDLPRVHQSPPAHSAGNLRLSHAFDEPPPASRRQEEASPSPSSEHRRNPFD